MVLSAVVTVSGTGLTSSEKRLMVQLQTLPSFPHPVAGDIVTTVESLQPIRAMWW